MRTDIFPYLLLLVGCSDATVSKNYLAVISVSPDQGATQVAVDTNIIAGFSEALEPSTVDQQSVYITDSTGGPVVTTVSYESRAHWIVLDPEADLAPNSTYVVTFTSNIKGQQSGFLLAPVQTEFTTAGINPTNELPIAEAGPDLDAAINDTLTLDGSASEDPEGAALTFDWRVVLAPADSVSTLSSTDQPTPTITVDKEGEYIIGLVVNDGIQSSSEDFMSIRVGETPPIDDTGETGDADDSGSIDAPDTGE